MTSWHDDPLNQEHLAHLRQALAAGGRLLVFLGAGLSFGAARIGDRSAFDREEWGRLPMDPDKGPRYRRPKDEGPGRPPGAPPGTFDGSSNDDWQPLPSWPWLISRMRHRLTIRCHPDEQASLDKFFREQGPLDCAQLFRQTVGESSYRDFLVEQFDASQYGFIQPTPSHVELVALDLPLLFTTNFDELIERAYHEAGVPLRVSSEEEEFKSRRREHPPRHLVKLHGSIDRPPTIVLTRDDYQRARSRRREMLGLLREEMAQASFLFVGFSLSDPNFGLIHDDIRESLRMETPTSYTVQGRRDPIKERYLTSMSVNTIWLDGWGELPQFLRSLHL